MAVMVIQRVALNLPVVAGMVDQHVAPFIRVAEQENRTFNGN